MEWINEPNQEKPDGCFLRICPQKEYCDGYICFLHFCPSNS